MTLLATPRRAFFIWFIAIFAFAESDASQMTAFDQEQSFVPARRKVRFAPKAVIPISPALVQAYGTTRLMTRFGLPS
jgi:TRAP-type mannitol/chloroaromatic compound transport system permease small subunit